MLLCAPFSLGPFLPRFSLAAPSFGMHAWSRPGTATNAEQNRTRKERERDSTRTAGALVRQQKSTAEAEECAEPERGSKTVLGFCRVEHLHEVDASRESAGGRAPNCIVGWAEIGDYALEVRVRIDERVRRLELFDGHLGRRDKKKGYGCCGERASGGPVPEVAKVLSEGDGGGNVLERKRVLRSNQHPSAHHLAVGYSQGCQPRMTATRH